MHCNWLGPPLPIKEWGGLGLTPEHLEQALPFQGVTTIPKVKPGCTIALILLPMVTTTKEEMENLINAWLDCRPVCPICYCNGCTPSPSGRAEGPTLQCKASIKDLEEDRQLLKGMPRYDEFLIHFFSVHQAQGYTVFYTCPKCRWFTSRERSVATCVPCTGRP
jgi:hypothetical protein